MTASESDDVLTKNMRLGEVMKNGMAE